MDTITLETKELRKEIQGAVYAALSEMKGPERTVLLRREAVSKRLNVNLSTLWRWDKIGYLPVTTRIGRTVYYSEDSIKDIENGIRREK